jgi:hypothetical protein
MMLLHLERFERLGPGKSQIVEREIKWSIKTQPRDELPLLTCGPRNAITARVVVLCIMSDGGCAFVYSAFCCVSVSLVSIVCVAGRSC